jgi:hypothetical protein
MKGDPGRAMPGKDFTKVETVLDLDTIRMVFPFP